MKPVAAPRAKHIFTHTKGIKHQHLLKRDELTCARALVSAPARGRIPVPRALNQAFKIINLITVSTLLLSLQLLAFSRCWKGQISHTSS